MTYEELFEKACETANVDELAKLASQYGFDMDAEQLQSVFDKTHAAPSTGELSDNELEDVAGGCGSGNSDYHGLKCPKCGGKIVKVTNAPAHCMNGCSL